MSSIASSNLSKRTYKIVLLGNSGVGKTSLINRFCHNKFDHQSNPTVGIDFVGKNITHQGVSYRLQLWDTAGQERYRSLIPTYLKDALCSIFIYDSTNGQTLESIESWIQLFKENKSQKSVLILCGNKIDIVQDQKNSIKKQQNPIKQQDQPQHQQQNSQKENEESQTQPKKDSTNKTTSKPPPNLQTLRYLMNKYKLKHFEVSAATGLNVNDMFHSVIEMISEQQEKKKKKFASDYEIPASSANLFSTNMTNDMMEDGAVSIRLSADPPMAPNKKRKKRKIRKESDTEETQDLQSGEAVSFWKRYCKCCWK